MSGAPKSRRALLGDGARNVVPPKGGALRAAVVRTTDGRAAAYLGDRRSKKTRGVGYRDCDELGELRRL